MREQEQTIQPITSGVIMQVTAKYKKNLLIIGLAAIILSTIFSSPFFITPLYKSIVILYPTASKSISKVLLSENIGNAKDILEFGEEEQTEQMLQVLNSNLIRDRVITKYDLLAHYDISPESDYKMTRLFKEYESNFNFRRTEYMAVKITVLDKDAQMAADMANDIAELVDSAINRMQKEVAVRAFKIVGAEYHKLLEEVKTKEDSLTKLRKFGVHDYESQSEMFNRQLAIEMARGNNAGIKRLEKKLATLAIYGGPYVSIRDALEHDKKQLSEIKSKYEEAKVDATESLPHKFVVSSAYKAERKSYPIRWLIVVITTFSALVLGVFVFGVLEAYHGRLDLVIKKKRHELDNHKSAMVFQSAKNEIKPVWKNETKSEVTEETITGNTIPEKEMVIEKKPEHIEEQVIHKKQTEEFANPRKVGSNNPHSAEKKSNTVDHNNIEMDNYFNSANLLSLVDKWKYHLLVILAIAAILAAIFSGPAFITPLYKSYAIAYPANVDSYSDESETEQMLQIIGSQDIIDSIIERFNLPEHYEIDRDYKYFRTALLDEYRQNVKISKTPYESVLVEVQDKNPDTAALMVTAILDLYNKKVESLHKSKYKEVIDMYAKQLAAKRASLDSLKNIMYILGTEYGLIEYGYQSQEIMKGYLKTVTGQGVDRINTKEVDRLLRNMEQKGGVLLEVVSMIQDEAHSYTNVKLEYELAVRFYNADMTYMNLISSPFPADKKSYPIRWLILLVVTFATFVFAILVLLFIEKRAFDKK
jgi:uncharacterized protein involved in exopolysaccharide biosynthesis